MILVKTVKLLILLSLVGYSVVSAAPDADSLFEAKQWSEAAQAYRLQTQATPDDGRAWYRFAISARESGDMKSAESALQKAAALEFAPIRVQLEHATQLVVAGDNEAAVDQLRDIYASGFTAAGLITGNAVLARMTGFEAFDELIAAMSVQAYPCEHDERFSEFDFWLGEWEVRDAAGNYAGRNRIEKVERGCLLTETWTGASGSTGFSINYVDMADGKWVQIWSAAGGTQINYRGGLTADGMRLVGNIQGVGGGASAPFRGLWALLPDGRVRQFFEQSNDGGETWTTWFDGYYTRLDSNE
jgi:hypothetical protein